jgi:hypothetical protein
MKEGRPNFSMFSHRVVILKRPTQGLTGDPIIEDGLGRAAFV